ncbi:AMP-binding protein [Streptomyces sp. NPDC008122]|uniref:AMP-binding protein n=1 Tax=Streptomyces sp. NPDC008122 TaxID=3364810 RepID=UPI0036EB16A6
MLDLCALLDDAARKAPGRTAVVALHDPNLPLWPLVCYGILRAGCVVVPLDVLLKQREIVYRFTDSGARAYVCFDGAGLSLTETAFGLRDVRSMPSAPRTTARSGSAGRPTGCSVFVAADRRFPSGVRSSWHATEGLSGAGGKRPPP